MLSGLLVSNLAFAAAPVPASGAAASPGVAAPTDTGAKTVPDPAAPAPAQAAAANPHPRVAVETTQGRIVVELDRNKAPVSVENFLNYVQEGHYNGTVFHRVIDGFMIQGGGYTEDFQRKPTHDPIVNEADNGLRNVTGSIAMARTRDPDSATAQFFINVKDNGFLDYRDPSVDGRGYTVFGQVVEGWDTIERILAIPTGHGGPFPKDVPQTTVLIEKAELIDGNAQSAATDDTGKPSAAKPAGEPAGDQATP
jgi:peptidyl-prolyl cis-trans isomerase B (cyclophilin B)